MNNATRGLRAAALALVLSAAAPCAAHAGWNARMHWRGVHRSWLTHPPAGGPRSVATGDGAGWVTLDPVTRTLYVANGIANTISVIDAASCNAQRASRCDAPVATLPTGRTPAATAIDARTRTLYASNLDDGTLSVFDVASCNADVTSGCGAARTTFGVDGALGVAIDQASDSVYVGGGGNSLSVIDGATCNRTDTSGCAVVAVAATGPGPLFPFADPATRTIYTPDNGPGGDGGGSTVTVIDARACNAHTTAGCAHPAATVPVGSSPASGVADPATGTVYVSNQADNTVSVIDGARCNGAVTSGCGAAPAVIPVAPEPNSGLVLDQASHTLYVVGSAQDLLSVVDTAQCRASDSSGCDRDWPTLQTGELPYWIDFDQRTRTLYTANFADDDVSVLDAAKCSALRADGCRHEAPVIDSGAEVENLALDRAVHTLYAGWPNQHKLDLLDSARCSVSRPERCPHHTEPVPGVSGPFDLAVDERTQTLYATNQDDHTVVLIDPATCNVSRNGGCAPVGPAIAIPARPYALAIDPRSHAIYVTGVEGNRLYRIDGAHCRIGDRSRCTPISGPVGETPLGVTLDLDTGTIYTANGSGTVSVVDARHCCAERARIAVGTNTQDVAFDPGTRTLYVADFGGGDVPGRVSVVDTHACNARAASGCGQTPASLAAGRGTLNVVVDPASHAVFTTDILHGTVSRLDGRTCNALRTEGCGRAPQQSAVGWFPHQLLLDGPTLYVTSSFAGSIQVLPVE